MQDIDEACLQKHKTCLATHPDRRANVRYELKMTDHDYRKQTVAYHADWQRLAEYE